MDNGDVQIYVAKKISEGEPKVPSDIYYCSECQESLWIAKDSVNFALDETIILCIACVEKDLIKNKIKGETLDIRIMKKGKPVSI